MLESKGRLDLKDPLDHLVLPACPVSRDSLVTMVALALLDHLGNLEHLVLKDKRVNKVAKALSAQLDSLDLKVRPVTAVCLVCLDPSVLLELADNADQLVKLDPLVDPEMKDLLDPLVWLDLSVLLAHLVSLDLKVPLVKKDPLVSLVVTETRDHLVLSARWVLPDLLVFLEPLDHLDLLDLLVSAVPSEKLAPWVLKDLRARAVNQVPQDLKENVENVVSLELREPRVTVVSSVCKDFLALSVLKEIGDRWVSLVHPVRAASLDLRALLVVTEVLDPRVSWDHLDLVVRQESLVNLDLLAPLVPLDLPVLLVSRWATMLLLWLQFLDRVRPRDLTRWPETIHLASLLN